MIARDDRICQFVPGIVDVVLLDEHTLLNIGVGVVEELPRELGQELRRPGPATPAPINPPVYFERAA